MRKTMLLRLFVATVSLTAATFIPTTAVLAQVKEVFAPTTTDTGQVYDLVSEYMFNNGDALIASDNQQIQQDKFYSAPSNLLYYIKRTDPSWFEKYSITNTAVALVRDTTAPPDQPNNAYNATPSGSLWMPRSWSVGQNTSFATTIQWFNRTNCTLGGTTLWPDGRHFLRYQGTVNMGGSLGNVDVIVVDRYHFIGESGQEQWASPHAERFWYATGPWLGAVGQLLLTGWPTSATGTSPIRRACGRPAPMRPSSSTPTSHPATT